MNSAAMYPPPSAPAANMYGNMPNYAAAPAAFNPLAAPVPNAYGNMPAFGGNMSGGFVPPPMPTEPIAPPQPGSIPSDWNIPSLTEDAARAAYKDFAAGHCCYGSSPAEEGVITNMESHNTYRYRLETFTESRSTDWAHKPHEGEPPDFNTQTAPQPWEMKAPPPDLFTNHKQELRVPFTSTVKDCHTCLATGKEQCDVCKGNGHTSCSSCHGSGKCGEEQCTGCNATGKQNCTSCSGQGMKDCKTCKGKKRLLAYIQLKVEWTNNVDDHVVEQNSGLKPEELRAARGKELFKNSQYLLYPLIGFPNPAIAEASERLIKQHQSKFGQTSRILQQRQTVELIPVTKVNYSWKGRAHSYIVYGNSNTVSDSSYPDTCCCVIL